jgi:hypothetical protein
MSEPRLALQPSCAAAYGRLAAAAGWLAPELPCQLILLGVLHVSDMLISDLIARAKVTTL